VRAATEDGVDATFDGAQIGGAVAGQVGALADVVAVDGQF